MKRGITLFDIHTPNENKPALCAVEHFMVDFKPDILIWGGDVGDWQSFSHWDEGYSTYQTSEDFEAVNTILNIHQDICGKDCKYVYLQGNHEFWVEKFCDNLINLKHKKEYNLQKRLRFKERNIKYIPINHTYRIGKLRFTHGLYLNEYHAKKTLLAYDTNIIYGHAHTEQSFTYVSPIDQTQVRTGRSRPCLCDLNPDYMKNKPHAWTHGFSVWYVRDDGSFNEYCVNITDGVFTFGKTYDGNI